MPVTPAPESLCAEATVLFRDFTRVASPGVGQTGAELQQALQSKWQGLRRRLRETCVVTDQTPAPTRQQGGRQQALELLQSFFAHRGHAYHREMSGPATAEQSCSRLSAHLSLGSLSMRELVQAVWQHQAEIKALPAEQRDAATATRAKALNAYVARLHWHCHFIQKLEDSPHHEVEHVHRSYVGLRSEAAVNETLFQAWANGHTGFPLIDACMRSLRASGWINFRMRAMLMSFASFQLWLHWRQTGLYLARLFTDYEPGIHWNQVQMQSGTTGINTVRVYNPVKQSHDQDPDGEFIRRWVPELQGVDVDHIHEPWLMTSAQQRACDCIIGKHYPEPIVDHMQTAREARQRIYAVRNSKQFAAEADDIQSRHGSRKSGLPNRGEKRRRNSAAARPVESPQQSFGF
jgi:deoxyribodipyrimidine photo-lyase